MIPTEQGSSSFDDTDVILPYPYIRVFAFLHEVEEDHSSPVEDTNQSMYSDDYEWIMILKVKLLSPCSSELRRVYSTFLPVKQLRLA